MTEDEDGGGAPTTHPDWRTVPSPMVKRRRDLFRVFVRCNFMTSANKVVVVGGSLGGMDALRRLVRGLPKDFPAALLAVLHTSAASPRLLAAIVGRESLLPVSYAEDGEQVRSAHVYLAPPERHLVVRAPAMMALEGGLKVRYARPAADRLFQSAARVYGARTIGVVLTGGDSDGTDGLQDIKSVGGIAVVQAPDEALNPSMPVSALRGAQVDYCVSLAQMPSLLSELLALMEERGSPAAMALADQA